MRLNSAEGWAYDRNNINYDVPIDVMVNGKLYASGLANLASPVVNRVHNITGAHAFRIPLNITAYGTHTVTAVSTINGRRRPLMGSFDVTIKYPRGVVSIKDYGLRWYETHLRFSWSKFLPQVFLVGL